ncbi:hypothetical protein ACFVHI_34670 [Kitasatospora sp. NPDC127121]|uniref:hypothetical protein n=1 Tax=unclassified Kitasatospora TaxID=2633591 RepID=UPI003630DFE3
MRSRIKALMVAAAVSGSLAFAAAPAEAGTATVGICHSVWGGDFYCASDDPNHGEAWLHLPQGQDEVFVIGTDGAVWTRWNGMNGTWLSDWKSMGGHFQVTTPAVRTWANPDSYTISAIGTDGRQWVNSRNNLSGNWSGWSPF